MNKIIFSGALAFFLISGQPAFADNTTGTEQAVEKSCSCAGNLQKMSESLQLDETQQTKIKAIKDQLQTSENAIQQQLDPLRVQINQLIQAESIDSTKLDTLVNQKKELMGTLLKAKIMAKNQIYNVLNAQQKTQYQQLIDQWENKSSCH